MAPWLLGWKDQGLAFDIALHFGTLLAVLLYFFRDWLQIARRGLRPAVGSLTRICATTRTCSGGWPPASIPIGVVGWFCKGRCRDHLALSLGHRLHADFRRPADGLGGFAPPGGRSRSRHVTLLDAIVIGIAQALAVVPGTSRSGITITAGLLRGFDRAPAARFSFLLSTPAIAAAAADAFYDLYKAGGIPAGEQGVFVAGVAASAITGCIVISLFLRYLRQSSLRFFVAYRVVLGILILALAFFRRSG